MLSKSKYAESNCGGCSGTGWTKQRGFKTKGVPVILGGIKHWCCRCVTAQISHYLETINKISSENEILKRTMVAMINEQDK